jgi:MazG family protein
MQRLIEITRRLRAPDGCPWDQAQTIGSLRPHLLEEAYEVLEAIDSGDRAHLREELGDLLFQILFLAQIASEEKAFDVEEVAAGIADKLERRHPHVFGQVRLGSAGEALQQWEALKDAERRATRGSPGVLSGVPRALPALLKAHRLSAKAGQFGFDWSGPDPVLDKVEEELRELRVARRKADAAGVEEEIGDLLFALASLSRHLSVDPEAALQRANRKFTRRFERVERKLKQEGRSWKSTDASELERLWNAVKREGAKSSGGSARRATRRAAARGRPGSTPSRRRGARGG